MPPAGAGSDIYLPGLTLQPLVENAVRHGIAKRREGGLIKIRLDRTESTCTISVANQVALSEGLPILNMQDFFRPGHSLSNTRDRLSLVFRNQASLEVVGDGTDWIRTVLRLPIQRESS
jgi:LytS/YehU family sensor histidine kinase